MMSKHYLEQALATERWINSHKRTSESGTVWSHNSAKPDIVSHSLYNGTAGTLIYYLELYAATGESDYLEIAVSAADDLIQYVDKKETAACAMYTGWPGYVFALGEVARASHETRFSDAAALALNKLKASSTSLGCGIGWVEKMPFTEIHGHTGNREIYDASVGAAGAGFVMLYAANIGLHDQALAWATAVGDRLLEVAYQTPGGLNWALMSDMPFKWTPSNFAHGAAGVGAFLAQLFNATSDPKYLEAAQKAADHLIDISKPVGDGLLIPHFTESAGADRYYLGACHGPAGTSRLFHQLAWMTNEKKYQDWNDSALKGLLAMGAPEERSAGYWNNYGQCCGDAGVGDYALQLFHTSQKQTYLELAKRVAKSLEAKATEHGTSRCWDHAEHRERPEFLQSQTGYMQGAAGIGSFLLHLHTTLIGQPVKIAFPDLPYPSFGMPY